VTDRAVGPELAAATDEQLDDVARYADPMALRGLLYQLTGDEEVAATRVSEQAGIDAAGLGVQVVPELARRAGHVYSFQRTPQWLFDRKGYLAPFPDQVTWLDRNFPYYTNFMRFRANSLASPYLSEPVRVIDPDFDDPHARSAVNKRLRDERIAFIQRKLGHQPDLALGGDDVAGLLRPVPPDVGHQHARALAGQHDRRSPAGGHPRPRGRASARHDRDLTCHPARPPLHPAHPRHRHILIASHARSILQE